MPGTVESDLWGYRKNIQTCLFYCHILYLDFLSIHIDIIMSYYVCVLVQWHSEFYIFIIYYIIYIIIIILYYYLLYIIIFIIIFYIILLFYYF